ncbi:MAG: enoyl-CoA hydratase-related protein [Candidatus Aminicenantes bacterium]|nr:enoyl-CoA hydratase-related protein [Candidatus Aminicenantes bacterium]MDH5384705.1 enoyl-CoA hydratase-related protein [Candidatus Aminicenantes bacterium]MDH5742013.1 enoyl-CoA hydratase-related protein [Candidatus Aminicenantes bacterium]
MDYANLLVKKEPPLGYIIINRPDKLNALNAETIKDLYSAFLSFREVSEIRVVILTGSGEKAFVAGADISELAPLNQADGKDYVLEGQELTKLIENYRKPVIAAINGYALGGGTELALSCHIRIASENAKMGQPEVKLGLIPGFGGTQRLARLVGKGKAMELILSGRMIDAQEALAIGLVNQVVPFQELITTCEALAKEIADNAPLALEYSIKAINEGLDKPLSEGLLLEAELFGNTCSTEDSKEGTQAFLDKRKANFEGK